MIGCQNSIAANDNKLSCELANRSYILKDEEYGHEYIVVNLHGTAIIERDKSKE